MGQTKERAFSKQIRKARQGRENTKTTVAEPFEKSNPYSWHAMIRVIFMPTIFCLKARRVEEAASAE